MWLVTPVCYMVVVYCRQERELPDLIRAQRAITSLNARLVKEEMLIGLSADEPELWHKVCIYG